MENIYNCELLNRKSVESEPYSNIFNGNFKQQVKVCRKFEKIMRKREILMEIIVPPCDPVEICSSLLE